MFNARKRPLPETTTVCTMLLKTIIESIESPSPFIQAKARDDLKSLYKNKCKEALLWIYQNYKYDLILFKQDLAREAYEYFKSL